MVPSDSGAISSHMLMCASHYIICNSLLIHGIYVYLVKEKTVFIMILKICAFTHMHIYMHVYLCAS